VNAGTLLRNVICDDLDFLSALHQQQLYTAERIGKLKKLEANESSVGK